MEIPEHFPIGTIFEVPESEAEKYPECFPLKGQRLLKSEYPALYQVIKKEIWLIHETAADFLLMDSREDPEGIIFIIKYRGKITCE